MNNRKPIKINKWLIPFSWFYGSAVSIRNKFFKWGIYKRKEYPIPIICVGNISVGGTGKTPHTEYFINLLKEKYKVAVLSRGYKRKTDGFILSTMESTAKEIGDEPYQIKQKFGDQIIVAVDKNRCNGIEELLALKNPPQVIIMDDGFQHRYVKPSYTIILSDYNRPIYEDKLLPAGRLREPARYLRQANDIIVTKCPESLLPLEYRLIGHDFNPFAFQGLYFTTFKYKELAPLFPREDSKNLKLRELKNKSVLLVTAIASSKPLKEKLSENSSHLSTMQFADHYTFEKKDLKAIMSKFNKIDSDNKIIVVTEKDAGKLRSIKDFEDDLKPYFYYLPIEVSFLQKEHQEELNHKILEHVRKNTRNK